jgi:hypothetical protein
MRAIAVELGRAPSTISTAGSGEEERLRRDDLRLESPRLFLEPRSRPGKTRISPLLLVKISLGQASRVHSGACLVLATGSGDVNADRVQRLNQATPYESEGVRLIHQSFLCVTINHAEAPDRETSSCSRRP